MSASTPRPRPPTSHTLGHPPDHWTYTPPHALSPNPTYDLSRRPIPSDGPHTPPPPHQTLAIKTVPLLQPSGTKTRSTLHLSPDLTALVIIDMQNFFLSPSLGRDAAGPGHAAMRALLRLVPKCREAGVRVVWCNWGMTEGDLGRLPPAVIKGFGGLNAFAPDLKKDRGGGEQQTNIEGEKLVDTKPAKIYKGFGTPMGPVTLDSGGEVDAGRLLMRGEWNAALCPPLQAMYEANAEPRTVEGSSKGVPEGVSERVPERVPVGSPEGSSGEHKGQKRDVWMDKNRMSGMWSPSTPLYEYLTGQGIRTLLFAGVNTDQCVQGTLVDAYNAGWDCLLVRDGCGTGTPGGKEVSEWNAGRSWGFLVDTDGVVEGVKGMMAAGRA